MESGCHSNHGGRRTDRCPSAASRPAQCGRRGKFYRTDSHSYPSMSYNQPDRVCSQTSYLWIKGCEMGEFYILSVPVQIKESPFNVHNSTGNLLCGDQSQAFKFMVCNG